MSEPVSMSNFCKMMILLLVITVALPSIAQTNPKLHRSLTPAQQKQADAGLLALWINAGSDSLQLPNVTPKALQHALAAGAHVDARDKTGQTTLIAVSLAGRTDLARILLAHGANPNAKDHDGSTALFWAALMGHEDTVRLLLADRRQNFESVNDAVALADTPEILKLLLAHGGKVGSGDLLYASDWGRMDAPLQPDISDEDHGKMLRMLIAHGAQVDTRGPEGETPLMMAAGDGHTEAVLLLLAHGAKINTTDSLGRTPLMYAAGAFHYGWSTETAKILISHGADVNAKDNGGHTAVSYATENEAPKIVTMLKAAGEK